MQKKLVGFTETIDSALVIQLYDINVFHSSWGSQATMPYLKCSCKKRDLVPLRTQEQRGLREEVLTPSLVHWLGAGRQQQWITNYHPEEGAWKGLDQSLGLQTQAWPFFAKFRELLIGLQYTDRVGKKGNHGRAWDECAPKESRGWKLTESRAFICINRGNFWDICLQWGSASHISVCVRITWGANSCVSQEIQTCKVWWRA